MAKLTLDPLAFSGPEPRRVQLRPGSPFRLTLGVGRSNATGVSDRTRRRRRDPRTAGSRTCRGYFGSSAISNQVRRSCDSNTASATD
jgi:hypothetical protein